MRPDFHWQIRSRPLVQPLEDLILFLISRLSRSWIDLILRYNLLTCKSVCCLPRLKIHKFMPFRVTWSNWAPKITQYSSRGKEIFYSSTFYWISTINIYAVVRFILIYQLRSTVNLWLSYILQKRLVKRLFPTQGKTS